MEAITEIQALQNAANLIGLTIYEKFNQDKRIKVKLYFAQLEKQTISPALDYDNMNHFLLGFIKCSELYKNI
jgi:hypothetical protein